MWGRFARSPSMPAGPAVSGPFGWHRSAGGALSVLWLAATMFGCGDFQGSESEAEGAARGTDPAISAGAESRGAEPEADPGAADEAEARAQAGDTEQHLPEGAPLPAGANSPFGGAPSQHDPIEAEGDRPAPEFVPAGAGSERRSGLPLQSDWDRPAPDDPQEETARSDRFDAEARTGAEERPDCIICGRETGFLGRPELVAEVGPDKVVRLGWSAIEGADFYTVTGTSSGYDDMVVSTMTRQWRTVANHLTLVLPEDRRYRFTVMAWRGEPKARSAPSNTAHLDL
jgi:hypothetical protein